MKISVYMSRPWPLIALKMNFQFGNDLPNVLSCDGGRTSREPSREPVCLCWVGCCWPGGPGEADGLEWLPESTARPAAGEGKPWGQSQAHWGTGPSTGEGWHQLAGQPEPGRWHGARDTGHRERFGVSRTPGNRSSGGWSLETLASARTYMGWLLFNNPSECLLHAGHSPRVDWFISEWGLCGSLRRAFLIPGELIFVT